MLVFNCLLIKWGFNCVCFSVFKNEKLILSPETANSWLYQCELNIELNECAHLWFGCGWLKTVQCYEKCFNETESAF